MKEDTRIIGEGGEKRGGTNPGRPGKRPGPPPAIPSAYNEKYITRLLTFADTTLNPNVSCIVLSLKNVQELIQEIREDYISKKVLDLELRERIKQLKSSKRSYTNRIRINELNHISKLFEKKG